MAVYFQTWSSGWTDKAEQLDLTLIDPRIKIVYLAFAKPDLNYSFRSLDGTGLSFSASFDVVQKSIWLLKEKGVTVMLSVGGATYQFPKNFDPWPSIKLCWDLGCQGIDIDWEFESGGTQQEFANIVAAYRYAWPEGKFSAAVWSTGAFEPVQGDQYRGINLKGLDKLDWINIMAYDAGNDFNPLEAYEAYKKIFNKKIYLGFNIGTQAWGGHVSLADEIKNNTEYVMKKGDDIFIWAYQKNPERSPSVKEIFNYREPSINTSQKTECPHCKNIVLITISK